MAQILPFPADRARRPSRPSGDPIVEEIKIAHGFARDADAAHMARAEKVAALILKIEDALSHAALTGDDPDLPPVSWHTGRDFRRQVNLQLVIRGFKGREIHILDGEEAAMLGRALFADPGEAGCADIGARLLAIGDSITAMNAPLARAPAKVRAAIEVARQSADRMDPARPPRTPWGLIALLVFCGFCLINGMIITIDGLAAWAGAW